MELSGWEPLSMYIQAEALRMRGYSVPVELAVPGADFVAYLERLFEAEARNRAAAERAVEHFIATGDWPELDAWTTHFVFLRLLCAAEMAGLLSSPEGPPILPFPADISRESILYWLCMRHWDVHHDAWMKLHAVSLFYSLPFYGLDPAIR